MFGIAIHLRGEGEENTEVNKLMKTKINKPRFSLGRDWCKTVKLRACPYCTQSKASRGIDVNPGVALCAVALLGIPWLI